MTEGDEALGAEHTTECTDCILQGRSPEMYVTLLTNVTSIHLTLKRRESLVLASEVTSYMLFSVIVKT